MTAHKSREREKTSVAQALIEENLEAIHCAVEQTCCKGRLIRPAVLMLDRRLAKKLDFFGERVTPDDIGSGSSSSTESASAGTVPFNFYAVEIEVLDNIAHSIGVTLEETIQLGPRSVCVCAIGYEGENSHSLAFGTFER